MAVVAGIPYNTVSMVMSNQRWGLPVGGVNGEERSPKSTSDTSDDNSENDKTEKFDDICRDFLRNVCKRGKRCKYRHPEAPEARELGKQVEFTFCHDFQNSGCRRAHCKFIHCSREEEEYYKQTGQLPVRLQQAAALGIGVISSDNSLLKGEVPICKDYLKGDCKRAGRCKYRHLTGTQYEYEVRTSEGVGTPALAAGQAVPTPPVPTPTNTVPRFEQQTHQTTYNEDPTYEQFTAYDHQQPTIVPAKRRKLDYDDLATTIGPVSTFHLPLDAYRVPPPPLRLGGPADIRLLEEENMMLRRKVEELKKQVSDLAATNEVLLEQNARYRSNNRHSNVTTASALSIVTVGQLAMVTPTITTTVTPTLSRPMMAAVQQGLLNNLQTTTLAPITTTLNPITTSLASLNPLNTTLNHINDTMNSLNGPINPPPQLTINANSEILVSQGGLPPPTTLQRLNQEMASQPPSMNGAQLNAPPVSITIPTSIVPVSMGVETLATHGSISTLAQSSLHHNASLPQQSSLSGTLMSMPSTPLVSYPIMSHAQLPANSLNNLTALNALGSLNAINTSLGNSLGSSLG